MKTFLALTLHSFLFVFYFPTYSQTFSISESEYQKRGLKILETILQANQFPSPKLDSKLNLAAEKHGDYLSLNQNTNIKIDSQMETIDWVHNEREGLPGFIGKTPQDQAMAVGFKPDTGCYVGNTVLPLMKKNHRESPEFLFRGLLDTPFHRSMVLHPAIQRVGMKRVAYENGKYILVFFAEYCITGKKPAFVHYPVQNDVDIRLRMPPELPNPFPQLQYLSYSTAITVQLFFDDLPETELFWEEATLLDSHEKVIPISLLSLANPPPDTKEFLKSMKFVAFVANEPFLPNSEYTVNAKIKNQLGKIVFQKTWKFRTESDDSFFKTFANQDPK
ncbi:hypothetical protein EHQ68_09315 [Leptospira congkakensis]|uniref:CAP domain-containing protein n=1 Tax=Leptospira congkakensis TaxID=2484932 RepID=A0A4Z0ZYJ8_9LEPT|nr:hypothetical protein [Leptospira congkakensis]TGL85957.1 hypothetical protein EHQ69_17910 [Leptospira congkakensis]TGL88830.1 hypothetical protein EHQ68_09315 [Leptospira congkakensis]TGL93336.1 hypothetical protein EHQ70_17480 [Leptospira congkakensis]